MLSIFMRGGSRMTIDPPGGAGGAKLFFAGVNHFAIERANISRRSTVSTLNRGTSNIWAPITFFP